MSVTTQPRTLGWRRQTGRTTADVYWLAQGGAVMVWGPAEGPGEWWAWQGASDAARHETERDALMAAMAAWGGHMRPRANNRAARRAACRWPEGSRYAGRWALASWLDTRTSRQRATSWRLRWQYVRREDGAAWRRLYALGIVTVADNVWRGGGR